MYYKNKLSPTLLLPLKINLPLRLPFLAEPLPRLKVCRAPGAHWTQGTTYNDYGVVIPTLAGAAKQEEDSFEELYSFVDVCVGWGGGTMSMQCF